MDDLDMIEKRAQDRALLILALDAADALAFAASQAGKCRAREADNEAHKAHCARCSLHAALANYIRAKERTNTQTHGTIKH